MKTLQSKIDWNNEVKNNPTRFDARYYAESIVAPWRQDTAPRLFEFGDMVVKAYKCCPANGFTEKAKGWLVDFQRDVNGHTQAHTERMTTQELAMQLAELYRVKTDEQTPREDISEGMTVYPDDCLSEWHGRAAKVVRKYKADWGTWCLELEFSDGTRYDYAEKYVLTHQPWSVVGATCRHRWADSDVVLIITAAGQYYGIKAESEDGKVKWTGLARDFTPCTPDGRELLPEPPAEVTISTDGEGHEPTLYERHNITADERRARAEGSASYIRRQARMAREAFYYHKGARIETRIAYRNGTDDPDGMSYKVCWYDETRTGELHLVECENGISLEQAARHMADFSLLSECGLTLREILYPAA